MKATCILCEITLAVWLKRCPKKSRRDSNIQRRRPIKIHLPWKQHPFPNTQFSGVEIQTWEGFLARVRVWKWPGEEKRGDQGKEDGDDDDGKTVASQPQTMMRDDASHQACCLHVRYSFNILWHKANSHALAEAEAGWWEEGGGWFGICCVCEIICKSNGMPRNVACSVFEGLCHECAYRASERSHSTYLISCRVAWNAYAYRMCLCIIVGNEKFSIDLHVSSVSCMSLLSELLWMLLLL